MSLSKEITHHALLAETSRPPAGLEYEVPSEDEAFANSGLPDSHRRLTVAEHNQIINQSAKLFSQSLSQTEIELVMAAPQGEQQKVLDELLRLKNLP